MADEVKKEKEKENNHKGLIATIATALISAYVAITIAKVNAQSEFKKASLGYERIAESINKLEDHAKKQDEFDANLQGQLQALNSILQFAFASQSGKKYIVTPPPDIKTYGEFGVRKDRPPIRKLVERRDAVTPPKTAAAIAVEGLKNLQADADQTSKEPIKIEKLAPKL